MNLFKNRLSLQRKRRELCHQLGRFNRRRASVSFEKLEQRVVLSASGLVNDSALSGVEQQNVTARFAMLGDFGDNSAAQASVATMVASQNPDFIVTAGDNRYGTSTYQQTIADHYGAYVPVISGGVSAENLFFPAPGNHDYSDGGGIGEYLAYFDLPGDGVVSTNTSGNERYYDVIKGDVHFFFVDSDAAINDPAELVEQQSWLQSQMLSSTTAWQVVVAHHAPYSSGGHGSNTTMQWDYASWGADAVLAGHDHTYERISQNGIPFFVNGLGGRSIYDFGTTAPGSEFRYNDDYGAMLIEATPESMTFEFMSVSGALIDSYTIGDQNPPPDTGVIDRQVSLSSDDAEERASDGSVDLTSSDIELGDDPGFSEDQTVGLRFQNITIPQGAVITTAYLEFESDEIDSVATFVNIRAQATDNASTFTSALNDITSRPTTASVVSWTLGAWDAVDVKHQSPDLSSLVKEVVDRGGWSAGNSLAFIIDGAGSRTAESFDGEALAAAKLHIEYSLDDVPTLAAHWTLNEGVGTSVSDSTGNGNNGFFAGTPTWTTGPLGGAVEFDGSGEFISIPNPIQIAGDWTFTAWVKAGDSGATSMLAGGDTSALKLEQWNNTGQIGFTEFGVADYSFNYSAPLGQWVHLAFVKTDGGIQLYANGDLVDTNPNVISLDLNSLGGGDPLTGILDDVRVYDGALDSQEITALYSDQINLTPQANDDVAGTSMDVSVAISVLSNDTDGNGDPLVIDSFSQPINGLVTDNGDGTLTYSPNQGFLGDDLFSYTITDGRGGFDSAAVSVSVADSSVDTIEFSGRLWDVKSSGSELMGPGPNYFGNTSDDVWVDANGDLHLNISYRNGRWYSSEIISQEVLGYGTYTFTLGSRVDQLDPNIVVGLFTWDTFAPEYAYREIDIEFSRWGDPDYFNSSYTVQPYTTAGNTYPWETTLAGPDSTHSFTWAHDRVDFASYQGDPAGETIQEWVYQGSDIPPEGSPEAGANARINFWLFGGAPSDGQEAELIVKSFEFTPLGGNQGPIAVDDSAVTEANQPVLISPLLNDYDPDGDPIHLVQVSGVDNGVVTIDGEQLIFTPALGFTGVEVFDYTITDSEGLTASALVTVNVTIPNTPPSPNPMGFSVEPFINTMITDSFVAEMEALIATDPDGGIEYYFDSLEANEGEWWNGAEDSGWQVSSSFSDWNLQPGFTYQYRVKARDAWGNETDWSPVSSLTIAPVNQEPIANGDQITTQQGQSVNLTVLDNDFDPDGDAIVVSSFTDALHGAVEHLGNGTFRYTPNEAYVGDDSFSYTISDERGGFATARVDIVVEPITQRFIYEDVAYDSETLFGSADGDLSATFSSDGQIQTVAEELYHRNRRTRLEQHWSFNVTGGDVGVTFHGTLGHDSTAETIRLEYDAGSGWVPLVTLVEQAMANYEVSLPLSIEGPVFVRAIDTDRSRGEVTVDRLFVDRLAFVSERSTPLPPRVSVTASAPTAYEEMNQSGQFLISLVDNEPLLNDLSIRYSISGSASVNDYTEVLDGVVVIPVGQTTAVVSVTPVDDAIAESNEDIVLQLLDSPDYLLGISNEAAVLIIDNDQTQFYAQADSSINGSSEGSFQNLDLVDGAYQTLTEERYGGGGKRSRLEHQWVFDLTGQSRVEWMLDAEVLTPSDPDNFAFSYSTDGGLTWQSLLTLDPSSPVASSILIDLPQEVGEVIVRVRDTDSSSDRSAAKLRIDRMMFQVPDAMSGSGVDQFFGGLLDDEEWM